MGKKMPQSNFDRHWWTLDSQWLPWQFLDSDWHNTGQHPGICFEYSVFRILLALDTSKINIIYHLKSTKNGYRMCLNRFPKVQASRRHKSGTSPIGTITKFPQSSHNESGGQHQQYCTSTIPYYYPNPRIHYCSQTWSVWYTPQQPPKMR